MAREQFIEKKFHTKTLRLISQANDIIAEYTAVGLVLSVRQIYYQFVARGLIPNNLQSYKRLGAALDSGRLAGFIDWDSIEDRTRFLQGNRHWKRPVDTLYDAAMRFRVNRWEDQDNLVEVWVEKAALIGVVERACIGLDVRFFACRGYNSQSAQYEAGKRFEYWRSRGKDCVVIHLGDHDPSGLDMTRDNRDRLDMFSRNGVRVERLALNWDQIEEHKPPPNPAKEKDSRSPGYIAEFGRSSYELDALPPDVLHELITNAVLEYRDEDLWDAQVYREAGLSNNLFDDARAYEQRTEGRPQIDMALAVRYADEVVCNNDEAMIFLREAMECDMLTIGDEWSDFVEWAARN